MKINSLALVIAEPFLKRGYPGGVMGFLADQVADAGPNFRLTRKGNLVVVADPDPERLFAVSDRILESTSATFGNDPAYMIVDPEDQESLSIDCDWLSYVRLGDGSAEVYYTGSSEDAEAEPPEKPLRACFASDGIDAPSPRARQASAPEPTLVRLSEENGLITWLDTETGRQLVSPSLSKHDMSDGDAPVPMLDAAVAMLERRGWSFERDDDDDITFSLNAGPLLFLNLRFIAAGKGNVLILAVRIPGRVTEDRLAQVATYLAGANWLLEVGGFDMDLSDGEVMYRTALVASDGMLRPSATEIALDRSMHTVKYYAPGLIEVASGKDPREVLVRVEGE